MSRRVACAALALLALLALAAPASAYWRTSGAGAGTATTVNGPAAGQTPTASVTGQAVSLTWQQTTFLGAALGSRTGGGYTIRRYASGSTTPIVPNATCNGTVTGGGSALTCTEAGVPFGTWTYTVQPRLSSFTGDTSPMSAVVTVTLGVPTTVTATAQNPAPGADVGPIAVSWNPVPGATGYNVYRRTGSAAYGAPLNGSTPLTTTSFSDSTAARGTNYDYVVRAVAGGTESASSAAASATPVARPGTPTNVVATAISGARVSLTWNAPASNPGTGYNVYRRTATGTFDYTAPPLNGATPLTAASFTDTTAADGTTYRYVVRAVVTGASSTQLEGASSAESPAVVADGTPPPVPTAVTLTSGTPALTALTCGYAAGTKFLNGTTNAAQNATSATFTVAGTSAGDTVILTSGAATSTTPATATSTSATLNLSGLADGALAVTATVRDAAGNTSAGRATTTSIVKDTAAALNGLAYNDRPLFNADQLLFTSECGATVTARQTAANPSGPYTTPVITSNAQQTLNVAVSILSNVTYNVSATDLAGNGNSQTINYTTGL